MVYKKIQNETPTKPGKSEIIGCLVNPEWVGDIVTANRGHVVCIHSESPLTEETIKNYNESKGSVIRNKRVLRRTEVKNETWSKEKESDLGADGPPYQVAIDGEVLTLTRRSAREHVAAGNCISADSVRFKGSSVVPTIYQQAK